MQISERTFNYEVEKKTSDLPEGVLARVKYYLTDLGTPNHNRRIYEKEVFEGVLADPEVKQKLTNRNMWVGPEHPETSMLPGDKIAGIITDVYIDESINKVVGIFEVANTTYGQHIAALLKANMGIGVSTRAEGDLVEAEMEFEGKKDKYFKVVPESYKFFGADWTSEPSNKSSNMPLEKQLNTIESIKKEVDENALTRRAAMTLLESFTIKEAKSLKRLIEQAEERHCSHGVCEDCAVCKKLTENVEEAQVIVEGKEDQEFITQKKYGKLKKGAKVTYRNKQYKVVEPAEYPIGTPGYWIKQLDEAKVEEAGLDRSELKNWSIERLKEELAGLKGSSNSKFSTVLKGWIEDEMQSRKESKVEEKIKVGDIVEHNGAKAVVRQIFEATNKVVLQYGKEQSAADINECKVIEFTIKENEIDYDSVEDAIKEEGFGDAAMNNTEDFEKKYGSFKSTEEYTKKFIEYMNNLKDAKDTVSESKEEEEAVEKVLEGKQDPKFFNTEAEADAYVKKLKGIDFKSTKEEKDGKWIVTPLDEAKLEEAKKLLEEGKLEKIWIVVDPITKNAELRDVVWVVDSVEELVSLVKGSPNVERENWSLYQDEESATADGQERIKRSKGPKLEEGSTIQYIKDEAKRIKGKEISDKEAQNIFDIAKEIVNNDDDIDDIKLAIEDYLSEKKINEDQLENLTAELEKAEEDGDGDKIAAIKAQMASLVQSANYIADSEEEAPAEEEIDTEEEVVEPETGDEEDGDLEELYQAAIKALPDLEKYDAEQVKMGLKDEADEHADILDNSTENLAKVVLSHLEECGDYYTVIHDALEAYKANKASAEEEVNLDSEAEEEPIEEAKIAYNLRLHQIANKENVRTISNLVDELLDNGGLEKKQISSMILIRDYIKLISDNRDRLEMAVLMLDDAQVEESNDMKESVKIAGQAKIKEAKLIAEKEDIVEQYKNAFNKIESNYIKDIMSLTEKVNTLEDNTRALKEATEVIDDLEKDLEALQAANGKFQEELEAFNQQVGEQENAIKDKDLELQKAAKVAEALKEEHDNAIRETRVKVLTELSGLKLDESTLTLLKRCDSNEDLIKKVEEHRDRIAQSILHSNMTSGNIVIQESLPKSKNPKKDRMFDLIERVV